MLTTRQTIRHTLFWSAMLWCSMRMGRTVHTLLIPLILRSFRSLCWHWRERKTRYRQSLRYISQTVIFWCTNVMKDMIIPFWMNSIIYWMAVFMIIRILPFSVQWIWWLRIWKSRGFQRSQSSIIVMNFCRVKCMQVSKLRLLILRNFLKKPRKWSRLTWKQSRQNLRKIIRMLLQISGQRQRKCFMPWTDKVQMTLKKQYMPMCSHRLMSMD